jgi:hypothetical protein
MRLWCDLVTGGLVNIAYRNKFRVPFGEDNALTITDYYPYNVLRYFLNVVAIIL